MQAKAMQTSPPINLDNHSFNPSQMSHFVLHTSTKGIATSAFYLWRQKFNFISRKLAERRLRCNSEWQITWVRSDACAVIKVSLMVVQNVRLGGGKKNDVAVTIAYTYME